jgi:hypothetical protein
MSRSVLIIILLLAAPVAVTVNAHEGHQGQHCITLYALTFPPQKKCVILTHPTAQEEQGINAENTQSNAGVQAGYTKSLNFNSTDELKCPSHNKLYCSGWKTTAKYNITEYKKGVEWTPQSLYVYSTVAKVTRGYVSVR